MKKLFLLLTIFMLTMCGCQNSSTNKNVSTTDIKRIEDTTTIVIGYGTSSYVAIVKDQEEIKQLENLFTGAEFTKSYASTQQPRLSISFSGEKSSALFYIDDNDIIQLGEGNYVKSKQINFTKLYSIFSKYRSEKK